MQTIYLDISNKGVYPCIYAKQGDVDRKFLLIVTDNGVPFNCEEKAISVWYDGDSGEGNYTHIGEEEAISVTENKITVSLIQQMLVNAGEGVLSVSVSDANGRQIGLWNIDYCVEQKPGAESEEATQYYDAFSKTAADLAATAKTFTTDKTLSKSGSPADAAETGRQISLERARINELVSMRPVSGSTELTYYVNAQENQEAELTLTFKTNGTSAYVQIHAEDLPLAADQKLTFILNDQSLLPLRAFEVSGVEDLSIDASNIIVAIEQYDDKFPMITIQDEGASDRTIPLLIASHLYPLASVSVPEVADIRVTVDGVTMNTAGEAVRAQIKSLDESKAVIDDSTVGTDAWSAKNIVDKLCPAFEESGAAVRCYPVEGYPIEAVSTILPKDSGETWDEIELFHSGKNIHNFDMTKAVCDSGTVLEQTENAVVVQGNAGTTPGTNSSSNGWLYPTGKDYNVAMRKGRTHTFSFDWTVLEDPYAPAETPNGAYLMTVYTQCAESPMGTVISRTPWRSAVGETKRVSLTILPEVENIRFVITLGSCKVRLENFMLELSETATDPVPYKASRILTADLSGADVSEGTYNWTTGVLTDADGNETQLTPQVITAYDGVNTLVSNCGDTAVSGKSDPAAIIEKLTNAIIALGGNV